jgi:hypothetical protein
MSSGRKSVTFAVLDGDLKLILLEKCEIAQFIARLEQHKNVMLVITILSNERGQKICSALKKRIHQSGFMPYLQSNSPKQWVETIPRDCFRSLIGQAPLPRATLEGRIQRSLILRELGLNINDPMEFFEEITRHRMMMGVFPNDLLYSAPELDALVAAYVAWSTINRPVQVDLAGDRKDGSMLVLTATAQD